MGNVIDIGTFRNHRLGSSAFEPTSCPLCAADISGVARGAEVVYVCDGIPGIHRRLEWSHARSHVEMRVGG